MIVSKDENTHAKLGALGFTRDELLLYSVGNISNEIKRRTGRDGPEVIFSHRMVDRSLFLECALTLTPSARVVLFGELESRGNTLDGLCDFGGFNVLSFDLSLICREKPAIAARCVKCKSEIASD